MKLDSAKSVLKVLGILTIIGAVFTLGFGLITMIGGGAGATGAAPELEENSALLIGAGIVVVITGIINFAQGIFSVLASKNFKYGQAAWIFAIVGVASEVYSLFNVIRNSGVSVNNLISPICGIIVSIIMYMAADTVRKAYNEGK